MQQEHTILKILRNWRELYWKYGYEVHKTGLSSQILTRSQEDSSYLWSELTPDGEYFEVKHDNTLLAVSYTHLTLPTN